MYAKKLGVEPSNKAIKNRSGQKMASTGRASRTPSS